VAGFYTVINKFMALSIGIIGLPNVGKSTLFNVLTKKQVEASNYPFCTIDPNIGTVKVPDKRLEELALKLIPDKVLPTTIEFIDIAGLVKGAHKGEGLGNQFLGHIREVDAIAMVLREFKNADVSHVAGQVDSKNDKAIIELELIMADLGTVEKRLVKTAKEARSGNREILKMKEILEKVKTALEQGKPASQVKLNSEEQLLIHEINLLTMKPILYVFNVDESRFVDASEATKDYCVIVNAREEIEAADLSPAEMTELGIASKLDGLIKASYRLLGIITFFTVQNKILQAWTVEKGAKAPQAAGMIHTDMQAGFIRVEVVSWQKLVEAGSERAAREKGLIRIEGKDYIIKDGEICKFLFK